MTISHAKTPSGIRGLDAILEGGYPAGAPALVTGGPGTGKTVFGLSFIHGGLGAGEGAVMVTCDERPGRLLSYMDALGMAGSRALDEGRLQILDMRPGVDEEVAGAYDLDVIRLRIEGAVAATGATRLVIDSLDNLQLALGGDRLRTEILALFEWLRDAGLTTLVTLSASTGSGVMHRFEEYASDCVIHLSQQLSERLMTRYLWVVKMRGAGHGTNEYPFLLDGQGVSILPVTGTELKAAAPTTRTTTGIAGLDAMLGGAGYLDGSTLMVSGSAGTGKSLLAASLLHAALQAGRRAAYISLEESPEEIRRNLRAVGIDLAPFLESGALEMHSVRSVEMGLESHLIRISERVEQAAVQFMVIDPISALADLGSPLQVKMMLVRFTNYLKARGVSLLLTELLPDGARDTSTMNISSLSDVWIRLRQVESGGEVRRVIQLVKARGGASSGGLRGFTIGAGGIRIEGF